MEVCLLNNWIWCWTLETSLANIRLMKSFIFTFALISTLPAFSKTMNCQLAIYNPGGSPIASESGSFDPATEENLILSSHGFETDIRKLFFETGEFLALRTEKGSASTLALFPVETEQAFQNLSIDDLTANINCSSSSKNRK